MSKSHVVESTSHTTITCANARRAQRNKGNLTEQGACAEVNGSITLDHDPDERLTTVPHDTTLPNSHVSEVFGSASHSSASRESGTCFRTEGRLPTSPTVDGGSSASLAAQTRSIGLNNGTDWDDNDMLETHLEGGGLDQRDTANLPTVSLTSAESPLG